MNLLPNTSIPLQLAINKKKKEKIVIEITEI